MSEIHKNKLTYIPQCFLFSTKGTVIMHMLRLVMKLQYTEIKLHPVSRTLPCYKLILPGVT